MSGRDRRQRGRSRPRWSHSTRDLEGRPSMGLGWRLVESRLHHRPSRTRTTRPRPLRSSIDRRSDLPSRPSRDQSSSSSPTLLSSRSRGRPTRSGRELGGRIQRKRKAKVAVRDVEGTGNGIDQKADNRTRTRRRRRQPSGNRRVRRHLVRWGRERRRRYLHYRLSPRQRRKNLTSRGRD